MRKPSKPRSRSSHPRTQRRGGAPSIESAGEAFGFGAKRPRPLRQLIRNDPSWEVRASAGRAIGRLSLREAVPDLVRALRDERPEVRIVAAAALWRLPDPAAVPALVALLEDDDPAARQWGALALGVTNDTRSTEPLLGLLGDTAAAVRTDAIRSLGRVGDPAAGEGLAAFIADDSHEEEERLEAVNSLAALRGPEKVNRLTRLLSLESEAIRLNVIVALGQVGDALVIPALRRQRQNERGRRMRDAVDAAIEAITTRLAAPAEGAETSEEASAAE